MILIADAGSTKTAWSLAGRSTKTVAQSFQTKGINPAVMSPESVASIINHDVIGRLADYKIEAVYYYGAGIVGSRQSHRVLEPLAALGASEIEIRSDMLGAARSLLGHSDGIAGIPGTGANTCLYDGAEIIDNVPALGFILGDEGSVPHSARG